MIKGDNFLIGTIEKNLRTNGNYLNIPMQLQKYSQVDPNGDLHNLQKEVWQETLKGIVLNFQAKADF